MAGDLLQDARPHPSATAGSGWTAGRIAALAAGAVLLVLSLAMIGGGGVLTWADQEQFRSGYLTTGTASYATGGYALVSNPVRLHDGWGWLSRSVGEVRIRVTSADPARPLFAGIAPDADAERYLAGASHATVSAFGDRDVTQHPGAAVPATPASALPWAAHVTGTGTLTLSWTVTEGDWVVVVMNSDATKGVAVRADVGVSSPVLSWLAGELLVAGVFLAVLAAALIVLPVRLVARSRR